jgi:hypothetical protein
MPHPSSDSRNEPIMKEAKAGGEQSPLLHVLPKGLETYSGLHLVLSRKMQQFIITVVRPSHRTGA